MRASHGECAGQRQLAPPVMVWFRSHDADVRVRKRWDGAVCTCWECGAETLAGGHRAWRGCPCLRSSHASPSQALAGRASGCRDVFLPVRRAPGPPAAAPACGRPAAAATPPCAAAARPGSGAAAPPPPARPRSSRRRGTPGRARRRGSQGGSSSGGGGGSTTADAGQPAVCGQHCVRAGGGRSGALTLRWPPLPLLPAWAPGRAFPRGAGLAAVRSVSVS